MRRIAGAVCAVALCALIGIGATGCSHRTGAASTLARPSQWVEPSQGRRITGGKSVDTGRGVSETALPPQGELSEGQKEKPPSSTGAVARAPDHPVDLTGSSTGLRTIYFDYDQYALSAAAREIVSANARILAAKPGSRIRIEGYCDERGTTEYNIGLGERRARSALQYLVDLGVDPNRMTTLSFGKERPADPRHTEEAWAKNRRVEFVEITD
jgi:peptidoglycan-associated lipoprotein